MIPLLLMLLLPASLAEQVFVHIENNILHLNTTNSTTSDKGVTADCSVDGFSCCFHCIDVDKAFFNGTSFTFNATVIGGGAMTVYNMMPAAVCELYRCENESIAPMLMSLAGDKSFHRELEVLVYLRQSCIELFTRNRYIKESYIDVEKHILDSILAKTQLDNGTSETYDWGALTLCMANITGKQLSGGQPAIEIAAPQLLPENSTYIPNFSMPVSALQEVPEEERVLGVASYMDPSQFQFKEEEISSVVLRIELNGKQLRDLNTKINMTFRTFRPPVENSSYQCRYFDIHHYEWKKDGCETDLQIQDQVTCRCDHATPFAVLLIRDEIAQEHWQILSVLSYIGCGLSAFFTALCLLIYVFSRNYRLDYSIAIHVSLSGALFLLNTTFLFTEWGARVKEAWVCEGVAAVMHYSLLCSFTWMAIEALHLYLLLIKVFNTYYKHYLLKLSLAGWGIPCVIVAVSLGVRDFKQFYGVTHMSMADTNQTNSICWITDDSYFYSLNLGYFALIFVFNSGILMAVASSICKMKQAFKSGPRIAAESKGKAWGDTDRLSQSCRSGLTVLGLTCLMGTTWGLAFLGSGYVNYPILYLFCILNSMQGFFIFLWVCLSAQKQRRRQMEDRMTSNPAKTTTTTTSKFN